MYCWKTVKTGIVSFRPQEKIFGIPIKCDAVLDLLLPCGIPDEIYGECHLAHDDQLKIIEGNAIVLIIINRQMHYIPLNVNSDLLIIPTGTWHSLVNTSNSDVRYQNWMIIKRPSVKKDYYPTKIKHKFDVNLASISTTENSVKITTL
jgi:hypothetical protein